MKEINSKHETRNPKQARNQKFLNSKRFEYFVFNYFRFVSNFEFVSSNLKSGSSQHAH
jgi:hypothetical protein